MDKYTKVRQIGEGAFGKAILVKKKNDGKQFVIKEINIRKMSPKERQDSKKEVAVLAQLSHPNIVTYRESFEEIGSLYIVMDFCEKGDLYGKINSQRGILFPEEQVMDWFVQICLAIKHIHDRKILHRDIKSQNIFLSADGSVRLGDFGIAKVLGSTVELARTCIGTPYYLSPEIVENRPYNNKSDIWSLGCVLYEMATLKHAFEAGNMKNLVLKIIRGSYPPISPKYSYDLRGLIAQLFKRAPKERPSINSILKKPFIQKKVSKFLPEHLIADEFSHTVMHGQKLARELPPPPRVSKPPAPRKATPAKPVQKYNPASIYGAPIVRKSQEKKQSAEKKRPGSAGPSRPGSAGPSRPGSAASRPGSAQGMRPSNSNQDLRKKRQDLMDKEKKRQEEKIAAEKRHKDLIEKQKMARINKAREEGWRNLMGSDDGDKKDRNGVKEQPKEQVRWPPPNQPAGDKEGGKYDQYHAYLDKLQMDRDQRLNNPQPVANNAAAYMAAPRVADPSKGIPNWKRPGVPEPTPVYPPPNQNRNAGVNDAKAERAKIVEDFVQRKREAALNKHRGQADIFGNARSYDPTPQQKPDNDQRPGSARNREEQDYIEKLRQIRQQNYQERRNVMGKNKNEEAQEQARKDAEARRKKIEALRQQADDRAQILREQLEKDRRELFEKEKRLRQLGGAAPDKAKQGRPLPVPPKPQVTPAPAVSMTGVLNAIGAEPPKPVAMEPASPTGFTSVLSAIGAKPADSKEERAKSPDQLKKDEILKKLNEKGAPKGKWGKAEKPEIAEEASPPESARSQWGQGDGVSFSNLPLEQTASQMEATSASDQVVKHPVSEGGDTKPKPPEKKKWGGPSDTLLSNLEKKLGEGAGSGEGSSKPSVPEKKKWAGPSDTLLNALAQKSVVSGTLSGESNVSSPEASSPTPPSVSATITISKPPVVPIRQGTITLSKDGPPKEGTAIGATITVDKPVIVTGQLPNLEEKADSSNTDSENKTTKQETDQSDDKENSNSKTDKVDDQPKCVAKPPLPSKPVVLPKPVKLSKPDTPKQFDSDSVPQASKTEGAGSLFTKPDSEDKTEEKEESKDSKPKNISLSKTQNSGVILGITCGQFDIGNAQMLRTCSEPDLAKLKRTNAVKRTRKQSLDLEKLKNEDEELVECLLANVSLEDKDSEDNSPQEEPISPLNLEEQQEEEGEEDNENDDDEDDEDLMSVRETMQSLLLREYSTDDEKRKSSTLNMTGSKEDDINESEDANSNNGDEDNNGEDEEDNEDKENGEEETGEGEETEDPMDIENQSENTEDLFQSDESDRDTQFGDDEEDYDLFSRLEESRAELEGELGCDRFLKVYKTVQALQEDEDENIEEGAKLVTNILGKEKEHLYPKIFQLVMADAAFTED